MRALDRKLLRDLKSLRGQAIAIGFVIAVAVLTYVSMAGITVTLQTTLDTYYREYRFADGFASVRRAPEAVATRLQRVPGVGTVQTRISAGVTLQVEGFDEQVTGTLYSLPRGGQPVLNRLHVREGRLVRPGGEGEVVLNEVFADAHDLRPADTFDAIINGRQRTLTVVGVALSPEFLMQVPPGGLFPDPERYGVMWMDRDVLAAAYNMEGAFNELAFTVAPGAQIRDVIDRVDEILRPYGGQGAYGRDDQISHTMIREEFTQLESMSTMLPAIVLAVAAFLLNIVVTRLIALQREQIAVLKAFGYNNRAVAWHFMKLVLLIAVLGAGAGTLLGVWLGRALAELYLEYFRFPYLEYTLSPRLVVTAVLLTSGAAVVGVATAVRKAVKLAPAEAMRPAPPASYRPTLVERLGLQKYFDQPTRIIMRNIERQPVKSGLTVLGMASACAIIIVGSISEGGLDEIIRVQYGLAQRDDYTVMFQEPTSTAALYELSSLPGVLYAEPFRTLAVELRNGHRRYTTSIQGLPQDAYLHRIIDIDFVPIPIPRHGLVLSDQLAKNLGAGVGDWVDVEVLQGSRRQRRVQVASVAQQYIGVGAYMDIDEASRLAGEGRAISGAYLMIDGAFDRQINAALRDRPRVAGSTSQERVIRSFMETSASTLLTFTFILSLFAGVIAFGVVYNSARISLSERDRELASLRVLGFTRGEISYILLGELALLTLLALPVGMALGALMSRALVDSLQLDLFRIPLVLDRATFTRAAIVILAAAVISAIIVRRRLNRLDLVGVLKTRE